jgi:hypothetical protein
VYIFFFQELSSSSTFKISHNFFYIRIILRPVGIDCEDFWDVPLLVIVLPKILEVGEHGDSVGRCIN